MKTMNLTTTESMTGRDRIEATGSRLIRGKRTGPCKRVEHVQERIRRADRIG